MRPIYTTVAPLKLLTQTGMAGRAADSTHLKNLSKPQSSLKAELTNPLMAAAIGNLRKKKKKKRIIRENSDRQNHIFRDVRGPRVSGNLNTMRKVCRKAKL